MKTKLVFRTDNDYMIWQSFAGNCIYAVQDINGKYLGDIKESDLLPFWDDCKIVSFDNPKSEDRAEIVSMFKGNAANWGVLPRHIKEVKEKLVKINILHLDKPDRLTKGLYYWKEFKTLVLLYRNKHGIINFCHADFFHDLFTSKSHRTCATKTLSKYDLVKITPENYTDYLEIENSVGSACAKGDNKGYLIYKKVGVNSIHRDEKIAKYQKRYWYLEDENFGKSISTITFIVQL